MIASDLVRGPASGNYNVEVIEQETQCSPLSSAGICTGRSTCMFMYAHTDTYMHTIPSIIKSENLTFLN